MTDRSITRDSTRPVTAARRRRRVTAPMSVLRQIAQTSALIESSRNDELVEFTALGR